MLFTFNGLRSASEPLGIASGGEDGPETAPRLPTFLVSVMFALVLVTCNIELHMFATRCWVCERCVCVLGFET